MNYGWKPGRIIAEVLDTVKVPDRILKSSAFVVSIASQVGKTYQYDFEGTGFFVGLFSKRCESQAFYYFVTAAHVLKRASPGK